MNYMNQWILDRFHCAWNREIGSNSELLNYQNLMSMTIPGITGWLGGWVWLLPLSSPFPQIQEEKKKKKEWKW